MRNNYICADCADKEHASWPKGHVATAHVNRCSFCLEQKLLFHITDYDWPDTQKSRNMLKGMIREL